MDGVRDSWQSVWRRLALGAAIAALLSGACLSGNAWAERGERRGEAARFERFVLPGGDPRDAAQREAIRDDRRQRRMSDEQRQQLRRDIDEAGRNIYRRPRRFPNE